MSRSLPASGSPGSSFRGSPDGFGRVERSARGSGRDGHLSAFIVWLANRLPDERERRAHHEIAEAYLTWADADDGDKGNRRDRFTVHATTELRLPPDLVGRALDRLSEHDAVVARTLPLDR